MLIISTFRNAVFCDLVFRWNRFRTLCDSNKKIGVVLELTADLPSEREILRWTSEPVKAFAVPTSIFITNKKGFPVLSRPHQNIVRTFLKVCLAVAFYHRDDGDHDDDIAAAAAAAADDDDDDVFQLNVQMILSGKLRHVDKGIRCYQLYLDHIFKVMMYL